MRKTIIALALSTMIAGVAAPAMARDNDRYPGNNRAEASYLTPARNAEIRRDINQLDNRIQRAQANHRLSPREAQGLRRDARDIKQTYNRYANRGLSVSEYRTLERRIAVVNARLQIDKRDRDGRRG
ncbi:hypothetical protein IP81_10870 [Novosphingobium sp. AAP83]|jgi:hypothetical protein|uniref:hypothetical protein n=1 Tax=Novosphingobium sp. AAP83 TaxID=1523425 RepID=UPI0006B916F5|nr:hypothetical protein [Novosphingobium sp. AAP83]KPF91415.1 hypothetical protein IP81_10870 [Novosphingobium sp. AAP83]